MNLYLLIWFALGIIFIISELFIPGFTIFFFGCGALITAFSGLLFPTIADNYIYQLILWLLSSVLSLVFLRKKFSNTFTGRINSNHAGNFIGKTALVISEIDGKKPGRIKLNGTSWNGEASENVKIYKNETVRIVKKKESESLTFIVEKIENS